MASTATDVLITAIRNAHSLETQGVQSLERMSDRAGDYPELQARLRQHLDESKEQRDALERLLGRYDAGTSALKQAAMGMAANLQAMVHAASEDEVLKNTFTAYAFEHFEIASYTALIQFARRAGDAEAERVAQDILRQEEAMAGWLGDNLHKIVDQYLVKQGHTEGMTAGTSATAGAL